MRKRPLFLAAAAGLCASLALCASGQAAPVYTFTVAPAGSQTIHATSFGNGSASATFTSTAGTNPVTVTPAPAVSGPTVAVVTYTQTAVGNGLADFPPNVNGGSYTNQSVSETVSFQVNAVTRGTFTVTETMNGFAYAGNLLTPGITTSGTVVYDDVRYTIFEQGTFFNRNTGQNTVVIGIESTAIPEPTSMALLGIGMASFIAFRKYFRRPLVA
jgi:hypothetical protein